MCCLSSLPPSRRGSSVTCWARLDAPHRDGGCRCRRAAAHAPRAAGGHHQRPHLPDMTGIDLVPAMRAEEALAALPFALVSSETRPQVLDPVRQSGACAILPKPFSAEQLATALRSALDFLNPDLQLSVDVDLDARARCWTTAPMRADSSASPTSASRNSSAENGAGDGDPRGPWSIWSSPTTTCRRWTGGR